MVGLIGAAIVMRWFFIVDLAAGVPLRTPALLGAALFDGARHGDAVTPTVRLVVGYTALHLAGFVALGLGVAGLFELAEREKRVVALIFLTGHVLGAAAMVAALAYFQGQLLRRMPEALDGSGLPGSCYHRVASLLKCGGPEMAPALPPSADIPCPADEPRGSAKTTRSRRT